MTRKPMSFDSSLYTAAGKEAGVKALSAGKSYAEARAAAEAVDEIKNHEAATAATTAEAEAKAKVEADKAVIMKRPSYSAASHQHNVSQIADADQNGEAEEILAAAFGPAPQDSATPKNKPPAANDNADDAEAQRILAAAFGEPAGD